MNKFNKAIVTGAYSYSGFYIAKRLVSSGTSVKTLTNSSPKSKEEKELAAQIKSDPLDFNNYEALVESIRGYDVLFNTFWIRHEKTGESKAIEYSRLLFKAAKEAGVKKIIHISIINPELDSKIPYFKSKAKVELMLKESGISYSILRPSFIFGGKKDVLINNLAWNLRKLLIFGYIGSGKYQVQPIHIKDLADLCVMEKDNNQSVIFNALGPNKLEYLDFLKLISKKLGLKRIFISVPFFVAYYMSKLIGLFIGDVLASKEELQALTLDLLSSKGGTADKTGNTYLADWLEENAESLGRSYFK